MLHAKTAVVDRVWSTVGSSNMDPMSFLNNDEVNAVVLSGEFADKMEAMFQDDLRESNPILMEQWKKRPVKERLKEWSGRLLGGWL
jgi:cardiolipin synthase